MYKNVCAVVLYIPKMYGVGKLCVARKHGLGFRHLLVNLHSLLTKFLVDLLFQKLHLGGLSVDQHDIAWLALAGEDTITYIHSLSTGHIIPTN